MSMELKVGRIYRDRLGRRYLIYKIDNECFIPAHGVRIDCVEWAPWSWLVSGRWDHYNYCNMDLIEDVTNKTNSMDMTLEVFKTWRMLSEKIYRR